MVELTVDSPSLVSFDTISVDPLPISFVSASIISIPLHSTMSLRKAISNAQFETGVKKIARKHNRNCVGVKIYASTFAVGHSESFQPMRNMTGIITGLEQNPTKLIEIKNK